MEAIRIEGLVKRYRDILFGCDHVKIVHGAAQKARNLLHLSSSFFVFANILMVFVAKSKCFL